MKDVEMCTDSLCLVGSDSGMNELFRCITCVILVICVHRKT